MPPDSLPPTSAAALPEISVVICTWNPPRERLARVLQALRAQSYPVARWELIIVDNASAPPLTLADLTPFGSENVRLLHEHKRGLTFARRTGLLAATGEAIVFVDDDNVLAPDYLVHARSLLNAHPDVGAIGGKSIGDFAHPPAPWHEEFFDLLAIRDLGPAPLLSPVRTADAIGELYPRCAPIGAGMILRRAAALVWLNTAPTHALSDRCGDALSSAGDNDIVFTIVRAGWRVGYFPELQLQHVIPPTRLEAQYLGRLNRAIQRSWVLVLAQYDASPWPAIASWTLPLRRARAYFRCRAWSSPARHVRWQGLCGRFEGQAAIASPS